MQFSNQVDRKLIGTRIKKQIFSNQSIISIQIVYQ